MRCAACGKEKGIIEWEKTHLCPTCYDASLFLRGYIPEEEQDIGGDGKYDEAIVDLSCFYTSILDTESPLPKLEQHSKWARNRWVVNRHRWASLAK